MGWNSKYKINIFLWINKVAGFFKSKIMHGVQKLLHVMTNLETDPGSDFIHSLFLGHYKSIALIKDLTSYCSF